MNTRIGAYEIVAELGRGGMGVVYKAFEPALNRYVAIKVLADALAHDAGVRERFLREARAMAALNDPHIVQIHAIGGGEDGKAPWFVMEFVDGESLASILRREGKLPVEQAARILRQTAAGLAAAHDQGVVHRDVKPGNLLVSRKGQVKVADFGIALSNQDLSSKLTSTGEFVGTPGYLSPEVCLGKPVDQRSDVFALGIVLFEMLTGRMPFNDESPLGLMLEVVKAEIPDVRELNGEVDPEIARILARMIAKEPDDRYQDCHALVADLAAHPSLKAGLPVELETRPSTAAQTLVGAAVLQTHPTPAHPHATADLTRVDATTIPAPPETPTRHATAAQVPQPAARGRGGLGWAIAAVLLLGIGASAWALRGPASELIQGLTASPDSSQPLVRDAVFEGDGANSSSYQGRTAKPLPPGDDDDDAATAERDWWAGAPASANEGSEDGDQLAQAPAPAAEVDGDDDWSDGDATPAAGPPGRSESAVVAMASAEQPTQMAAAAEPAGAPAPAVAKAARPAPVAAPPRELTVAVMVAGDEVITGPAADLVVAELRARGYRVTEVGRGSEHPDLSRYAGRADALLLVNARPVGTQELTYYGQSSTLYTVQLSLKAWRTRDNNLLWTSATEQVNFTSLNAADKALEAVSPWLGEVGHQLTEFRPRRRG